MSYNLDELKEQALAVVESNKLPTITSQEEFAKAGDVLKLLKNKSNALEEKRKTYTDPLLKQQRLIKADFDKARAPYEEAIERIEALMKTFYVEEKKRVDAEQAKLDNSAASSAGVDGALVPIVNDIKTQRGDFASTTVRSIVRWRVVAEANIPRAFLCPDEKKINEVAKEQGLKAQVPGIEFFEELSVTSR